MIWLTSSMWSLAAKASTGEITMLRSPSWLFLERRVDDIGRWWSTVNGGWKADDELGKPSATAR